MITKSKRTILVSTHVRPIVREALKKQAKAVAGGVGQTSMSKIVSEAIEEKLTRLGYDIRERTGPVPTPLFDGEDA